MKKAHCSKSKLFEKELLDPFQVSVFFPPPPPLPTKEIRMKYCSEIDYIVVRVNFLKQFFRF